MSFGICATDRSQRPEGAGEQVLDHYVVDIRTYNQLQGASQELSVDGLGGIPGDFEGDKFLLCLPATVPGYDTKRKAWKTLFINYVSLEDWFGDFWSQLSLPETRVKLLKRVISHHTVSRRSIDLKQDEEGSGPHHQLFILLHGPPGMGKSSTAECIARHARRALFRLTIGDMGTKPETLAQYLDTELRLAKRWNCVVLMDEVDYFVADLPIDNIKRNALVSAFLQALDNYKGILICRCSLVDSLDPTIKSRFQLTLRYASWSTEERLKVWYKMADNFYEIPLEVKCYFPKLAKEALDGHEIRNILFTASEIALQEKRSLSYSDIETVMTEIA
ncbi:P-loop containing nucleoside triphosphate hydrolase protein [Amylocarpus encephaloides]|uniref:P-loop containing nucleoside triphosphate hydrolase protein n=1 Tax=Amylocarpus encephaloides TaxID=45428 RepID=A0A9P7YIS5_9HELO|nr:P-loop containing nucleoside triphosphate hydrolase protein [Amylocarpus encephaloides]